MKKKAIALTVIIVLILASGLLYFVYPRRYVISYPVFHQVPYHGQETKFYCGEACIQMMLEFYGCEPLPSQNTLAEQADFSNNMTPSKGMPKPFNNRGFQVTINWTANYGWAYQNLIEQAKSRPVIILITLDNGIGHYLVVFNGDNQGINYHDPAYGPDQYMDYDRVRSLWNDNCLAHPPQPSCWILTVGT